MPVVFVYGCVMRRLLLIALLATATLAPLTARAQSTDHPFGLGFYFGYPSAFTAKYWTAHDEALQFNLGWQSWYDGVWYGNGSGPLITVDWIHRFANIQPHGGGVRLGFHVGGGGGVAWYGTNCYRNIYGTSTCYTGSTAVLYGRLPLGFSVYFTHARIELGLELVPALRLQLANPGPALDPVMMGGFSFRFYF